MLGETAFRHHVRFGMTEEPYRWMEAVGQRREYVREQLKEGSPAFAASLPDGILLAAVGTGRSKVFEIHDRHAVACLGHPSDIERIRQAAIDAAHVEAFTRAAEDVSIRRLVAYGLSPMLKQNFEQLFTAPVLGEFLFAELGAAPGRDVFARLRYDGSFSLTDGGAAVVSISAEDEARTWLNARLAGVTDRKQAAELLLSAWWLLLEKKSFAQNVPDDTTLRAGWRKAAEGKVIELGWLERSATGTAAYVALPASFLSEAT